jgi:hypothetical protein
MLIAVAHAPHAKVSTSNPVTQRKIIVLRMDTGDGPKTIVAAREKKDMFKNSRAAMSSRA